MDEIVFNGKTYRRHSNRWVDGSGMVVNDFLQRDLNAEFAKGQDIDSLDYEALLEAGNKYKLSGSYTLAERCFLRALEMRGEYGEEPFLLSRLFSCYRLMRAPHKTVSYFETELLGLDFTNKYAPAITSVAAAYCDLRQYRKAEKYCKLAIVLTGYKSRELDLVMQRIEKELEGR